MGGILEDTTNSLIGIVRGMLIDRFVSTENGTSQRPYLSFAIHTTERLLKLGSLCLYFPLQYHAALQRLNLIPLWPLLPNPFMKPLSSIILPPVPRGWDRRSLASWGTALFMSPVVTAIGMHFFVDIISNRLLHYSRAAMLRPDNPDPVSYRMIQADSMDGSSVVLDFSRLQTTIGAEIRKDINAFTQGASELKALLRNAARKLFFARRPSVGFPDLIEQNATRKSDSIYRPMIPEDFENSVNESITDSELIPISTDHPPTVPASPPLLSPTSSQRDDESEGGITSNVRIRTRTGSTSTLHMDVEFDTSARAGGAVHTSSFAASPHHGMISETVLPGSTSSKSTISIAELN